MRKFLIKVGFRAIISRNYAGLHFFGAPSSYQTPFLDWEVGFLSFPKLEVMNKAGTLLRLYPGGTSAAPVEGAPCSKEQAFQGLSWACRLSAKC